MDMMALLKGVFGNDKTDMQRINRTQVRADALH